MPHSAPRHQRPIHELRPVIIPFLRLLFQPGGLLMKPVDPSADTSSILGSLPRREIEPLKKKLFKLTVEDIDLFLSYIRTFLLRLLNLTDNTELVEVEDKGAANAPVAPDVEPPTGE